MSWSAGSALLAAIVGCSLSVASDTRAQVPPAVGEPREYVFASPGGTELKAYVFSSNENGAREPRSGIVLFYGGGWAQGEPAWAFARARHFAERGMVAVAAQYRPSDQKSITPIEAMADARAVIRWMRSQATSLRIDPNRIAAYGWSAGAHLAASAAIFDDGISTCARACRRPSSFREAPTPSHRSRV